MDGFEGKVVFMVLLSVDSLLLVSQCLALSSGHWIIV